jgi:hypothetical protein
MQGFFANVAIVLVTSVTNFKDGEEAADPERDVEPGEVIKVGPAAAGDAASGDSAHPCVQSCR